MLRKNGNFAAGKKRKNFSGKRGFLSSSEKKI
jgi:hypothetical protein